MQKMLKNFETMQKQLKNFETILRTTSSCYQERLEVEWRIVNENCLMKLEKGPIRPTMLHNNTKDVVRKLKEPETMFRATSS